MSNETIAQKLRRWADEADNNTLTRAAKETGIFQPAMNYIHVCEAFLGYIANEIEREQRENFVQIPVDKDGEPVLIGRAYYGGDGTAWKVRGFRGGGWSVVATNPDGETKELKGKWLSLNDPTILRDADGEPLEVDATYWPVNEKFCSMMCRKTGTSVELKNVSNGRCECLYATDNGVYAVGFIDAKNLTRKEPDSLEKLRDDVARTLDETTAAFHCRRAGLEEICDRLTSMIERDA